MTTLVKTDGGRRQKRGKGLEDVINNGCIKRNFDKKVKYDYLHTEHQCTAISVETPSLTGSMKKHNILRSTNYFQSATPTATIVPRPTNSYMKTDGTRKVSGLNLPSSSPPSPRPPYLPVMGLKGRQWSHTL